MRGEEEHCALPHLFAKSSSTLEYAKEAYATVLYHNKTPQYCDEFKIKLPALLASNGNNNGNNVYHLLFTFYHVSCQASKDQNQLETCIGYAWLPLVQTFMQSTSTQSPAALLSPASQQVKCRMIKSGHYSLPISFDKLPTGYSTLNFSTYHHSHSGGGGGGGDLAHATSSPLLDVSTNSGAGGLASSISSSALLTDASSSRVDDDGELLGGGRTTLVNLTGSASITQPSAVSHQALAALAALGANGPVYSKSSFDLRLKLVSTVHTQDVYIERFIALLNIVNNNSSNSRSVRSDQTTNKAKSSQDLNCCKTLY